MIEVLPLSGELEPSQVIDLWQCNSRLCHGFVVCDYFIP